MATGIVKWFDQKTGNGFIAPSDGSEYAFIHSYSVEKSGLSELKEGLKVSYDLRPGMDGKPSARNLKKLD
tara:strand:+ start:181 stop:390 length:210 start_codon:yes stop_codon:yes gene_type:complete